MSYTAQQAYDAIKKLEAEGQLVFQPEPTVTVPIGIWDASLGPFGNFAWAIPTQSWQGVRPPPDDGEPPVTPPGGHRPPPPPPPVQVGPVGEVVVNAIDVQLEFQVTNAASPLQVFDEESLKTISAGPGQSSVIVDVGNWTSTSNQPLPGFTFRRFTLQSGSSKRTIDVAVFHVDFPIVGVGAFTLPVVPLTLLYAPLPGPQKKNYAEYVDTSTCSRKIETSITSGTSTKTAPAYTPSDFATKISDTLNEIAGAAAAAIGLAGGGKQSDSGQPDVGKIVQNLSTLITDPVKAIAGIFADTSTDSSINSLTTTTDHAWQTVLSTSLDYQTIQGLGPGVGDQFYYLRNVKCAWMIKDGGVMITVLETDGERTFTAQELSQDLQTLSSPNPPATGPNTNLDAASLQMLTGLDPFIGNSAPVLDPKRFTDPTSIGGGQTGPKGEILTVTREITATDTETTNTVNTLVTDYKPSLWNAVFGSNQSTENQLTLTYGSVEQTASDQKQTCSLTYFVGVGDPPFLTGYSYDTWLGGLAFYPWSQGEMPVGS